MILIYLLTGGVGEAEALPVPPERRSTRMRKKVVQLRCIVGVLFTEEEEEEQENCSNVRRD